jgi:hypothetical protein
MPPHIHGATKVVPRTKRKRMLKTIASQAAAPTRYTAAGTAAMGPIVGTAALKVSVIVSSPTSAQVTGLQKKKYAVAAIRVHCRC